MTPTTLHQKLATYRRYNPYPRAELDNRVTWREKDRTEHFIRGRHVGYSFAPLTLARVRFLEDK
jgi:hypothetical protein